MIDLLHRRNKLFCVNRELLPEKLRTSEFEQELLVAVFFEFRGAAASSKYKNLTNRARMIKMNEFAHEYVRNKNG